MSKYLSESQPPTCLHILGQGLVDALWHEGRDLKRQLDELKEKNIRINIHVPEHSGGEPVDELIPLDKFISFEVGVDDNSFTIKKVGDITTYGDLYGTDTIKLTTETRPRTVGEAQVASTDPRTIPIDADDQHPESD